MKQIKQIHIFITATLKFNFMTPIYSEKKKKENKKAAAVKRMQSHFRHTLLGEKKKKEAVFMMKTVPFFNTS